MKGRGNIKGNEYLIIMEHFFHKALLEVLRLKTVYLKVSFVDAFAL